MAAQSDVERDEDDSLEYKAPSSFHQMLLAVIDSVDRKFIR